MTRNPQRTKRTYSYATQLVLRGRKLSGAVTSARRQNCAVITKSTLSKRVRIALGLVVQLQKGMAREPALSVERENEIAEACRYFEERGMLVIIIFILGFSPKYPLKSPKTKPYFNRGSTF